MCNVWKSREKSKLFKTLFAAYEVNPTLESRNTLRNLSWNYDRELRHNLWNHIESKIYTFQDYIEQTLAKLHNQENHWRKSIGSDNNLQHRVEVDKAEDGSRKVTLSLYVQHISFIHL